MNIRNIDLNLLHIFVTVYECRSITLAAKKLYMSQPAVSNAVNRLNNALNLKLFNKDSRCIIPSASADELYEDIKNCLQKIEFCLRQQKHFDPATSDRTFRIAGDNYEVFTLFPKLVPYLQQYAPNIKIVRELLHEEEIDKQLLNGKSDLILYFDQPSEQGVCKEFVFSDSFALVTGPSHPLLPTNPTIDDIAALDFISFGSDYDEYDPFFKVLKQHPNYRPSRFTSPNMLGTFCMVSASNLAIVAPLLLSQSIARQIPLTIHKIHDMPESVDLYLYWRETDSEDQSHRWFRELVKNLISNSKIQSPFFGPDTNDAEANTVYSILSKTMKENAGNRKRYSIESSTV